MNGIEYVLKLYDMTQQELADKLEIKRQNIDSWIRGKRNIPKKHLPKLAEIFNIPEEYFQKELIDADIYRIQLYKFKSIYSEDETPLVCTETMEEWETKIIDVLNLSLEKILKTLGENDSLDLKLSDSYSILNLNKMLLQVIEKGGVNIDTIMNVFKGIVAYQENKLEEYRNVDVKEKSDDDMFIENIGNIIKKEEDRLKRLKNEDSLVNSIMGLFEEV